MFDTPRLQYKFMFPDPVCGLDIPHYPFYSHWVDHVFIHAKDIFLSNKYITVISALRTHKQTYIKDLVESGYDEFISDIITYVCDTGDYDCDEYGNVSTCSDSQEAIIYQQRLRYLEENAIEVKSNMFLVAQNVFYSIFYQVYKMSIEAQRRGIKFTDITYVKESSVDYYLVTCHVGQEVIKNHDNSWYDRLSLLYTV